MLVESHRHFVSMQYDCGSHTIPSPVMGYFSHVRFLCKSLSELQISVEFATCCGAARNSLVVDAKSEPTRTDSSVHE